MDAELAFKQMLLDLVGELLNDLYLENYEQPMAISEFLPGVRTTLRKQYFRGNPRGPRRLDEAQAIVRERMLRLFKLGTESTAPKRLHSKSKWRSQKPMELVDSLLDGEMREQEHEWSNYEQEEHEAKLLISNTIFDVILKDTIECFQISFLKKQMNNS